MEHLAREAARPVVKGLAIECGQRFRSEIRVPVIRDQRLVELSGTSTEKRRPLEVRADQQMARFEHASLQSEEAARRGKPKFDILTVGQSLFETMDQGVHDVIPSIVLVRDELFENGDSSRGRAGCIGAILDAASAERRMGEARPLTQEAPDFDARIDALLEASDEFEDGVVPEEDGAIRLLGRKWDG